MLELVRIRNLALIEDVELEFCPGLNVLTGESGTGKSFILRALDFILGQRISADLVRPGQERAVVEAIFHLDAQEIFLRRELSAKTGRSRIFINDNLSSQERLAELRPRLLLHTSQHGQQRLLSPEHHVQILDSFLPEPQILEEQSLARESLHKILVQKQGVQERMAQLMDQREFLEFQLAEIQKVDPQPGEEEKLLQQREAFRDQEQVRLLASEAQALLLREDGLQDSLLNLERLLTSLNMVHHDFQVHAQEVGLFRDVLETILSALRQVQTDQRQDFDVDKIEQRLWQLQQLQRKLKRSLESVLALGAEIEENLSFLDASELELKHLDKAAAAAADHLQHSTQILNQARQQAAQKLSTNLQSELVGLGFSEHLQVLVDFQPLTIHPGIDEQRPRFFWLPNPGLEPQPLDRIASGGELSRFLLAVVSLHARDQLPTLLFDEVDSGIGGQTLLKVAERIQKLSTTQQIILVTHWPQLARLADVHFVIAKEVHAGQTYTLCTPLSPDQRHQELARMAGQEFLPS